MVSAEFRTHREQVFEAMTSFLTGPDASLERRRLLLGLGVHVPWRELDAESERACAR